MSTDREAVLRSDPDAFWCSVCQCAKSKSKDSPLQIANRDGSQLHSVCRSHVPKNHHEDREEVATHPVFHKTLKDENGNPVKVGTGMHDVKPNADGLIRSLVFEDLLKQQFRD